MKDMGKTISAVYENGVFKPLQKVDLPEHKRVHLVIIEEDKLELQKKELSSIIGIGESGISDISSRHNYYIYGR
jgi:predicted DNA-binding antitoxin AbrB/MazE fold protein